MDASGRIKAELKGLVVAMAFFAAWLGYFVLIKTLVLEEYAIEFRGLSIMLVGALVLAKVVLVLEHVPLGAWVDRQPAWVDVVVRTTLYSAGALVIMVLERAFESRHEHGGFSAALSAIVGGVHRNHLLADLLCVCGALLVFNIFSILHAAFGKGVVISLLLSPRQHLRPET